MSGARVAAFDALCERVDELSNRVIPPITCPLIDTVIKGILSAQKVAGKCGRYDDVDTLREALSDVDWELRDLESTLEVIREHNVALRQLGKDWHELAISAVRLFPEPNEVTP